MSTEITRIRISRMAYVEYLAMIFSVLSVVDFVISSQIQIPLADHLCLALEVDGVELIP